MSLEADDRAGALNHLADEITLEWRDHRDITFAGFDVTYRVTLRSGPATATASSSRGGVADPRWRRSRRRITAPER